MHDSRRIPTNLRTLMILEIIGKSDLPMTPTQINAQLGLPKQTIHRLCHTLEGEGFLAHTPGGKGLQPARRMLAMASGIFQASRFHIARHQILVDVARQVGETVNFVMPEEDGMSYVDRVETDWPFRVQLPIGSHVPFHCTASGKTFLAMQPKKTRQRLVKSLYLKKLAANTIENPELLLAELKKIAKQGYALDNEEFMAGMVAIAVPIVDTDGRFVAALAFHGSTMRMTLEMMIGKKQLLEDAASRIGEIMFQ